MDDATSQAAPPRAAIELLTVADLARIFQVSQRTIQRLIRGERIPYYRFGNRVRFAPEHVAEIKAMFEVRPITTMRTPTDTQRRRRVS